MGNTLKRREGYHLSRQANSRGSLWDVLAIVLLSMAVVPTVVSVLIDWLFQLGIVAAPAENLQYVKMISLVSAQEAALLFLTLGSMLSTGWSIKDIKLFRVPRSLDIPLGVGLGFGFIVINWLGEHVSRLFFSLFMDESRVLAMLSQENAVTDGLLSNEHPLWVRAAMGILIVFVAPVVEEMFFRGYAYNIFKKRLNTTQALFYSSLLFAAVHMYLIHFLPIFILGLILALIYERRQTLLVPIIAHSVMNMLVAIALLYL